MGIELAHGKFLGFMVCPGAGVELNFHSAFSKFDSRVMYGLAQSRGGNFFQRLGFDMFARGNKVGIPVCTFSAQLIAW